MAVVTTTTTTEKSEGNPQMSLAMLVFGGVGVLLGLIALIYAAVGANLAFEGSGVIDKQAACVATFSTYSDNTSISYNDGSCGTRQPVPYHTWKLPTSTMCGLNQSFVGCSANGYKVAFAGASEIGLSCTVAAAIFCMVASVPILLNGVFGILNKQSPATITAGVGIGLAVPSVCAITICAVIMIIMSAIASIVNDYSNFANKLLDAFDTGLCSPECEISKDATLGMISHLQTYFEVLRNINVTMIILMLIEAIAACISCCTWKKQINTVTVSQPVPGNAVAPVQVQMAQVVDQPVVAVVYDPSVPKTEAAL